MYRKRGKVISKACSIQRFTDALHVYSEWHHDTMTQTERLLGRFLLCMRRVMYRCRITHHSLGRQLPEQRLLQRLLLHAPGIECAQRSDNVRYTMFATRTRCCEGSVVEDGANVHHVEDAYVCFQPNSDRSRILE